ncbi:hypothetical protein HY085_00725 [Candidatus Gottesmanbacteria bacterium]|nr:hypothetical protein [Candidatus Gottesmanbacteria bacterium]
MAVKLVKLQREKLADLFIGIGHLVFGSTVLPYLVPVVDRPSEVVLVLGLGFAVALWLFAIWTVGK